VVVVTEPSALVTVVLLTTVLLSLEDELAAPPLPPAAPPPAVPPPAPLLAWSVPAWSDPAAVGSVLAAATRGVRKTLETAAEPRDCTAMNLSDLLLIRIRAAPGGSARNLP
jgi:hypothetical protein